jgi:hypothetical protein
MVWSVRKAEQVCYLVGTAHWFPYSFRASLTRLFKRVRTTIFEGPLDELSMQRVSDYGHSADGQKTLDGLYTSVCLPNRMEIYPRFFKPQQGITFTP